MQEIKNKLSELTEAFSRLSSREQLIVGIGIGSAILFIVAMIGFSARNSIATTKRQIAVQRQGIMEISALETTYRQAQKRKENFVKELEKNDLNLHMKVGTIADNLGLDIDTTPDTGGSLGSKSDFREEVIKVKVRRVGFMQLFDLFQRIEAASELLYIKDVDIRRRYDNKEQSDVTFTVATIKAKEA